MLSKLHSSRAECLGKNNNDQKIHQKFKVRGFGVFGFLTIQFSVKSGDILWIVAWKSAENGKSDPMNIGMIWKIVQIRRIDV